MYSKPDSGELNVHISWEGVPNLWPEGLSARHRAQSRYFNLQKLNTVIYTFWKGEKNAKRTFCVALPLCQKLAGWTKRCIPGPQTSLNIIIFCLNKQNGKKMKNPPKDSLSWFPFSFWLCKYIYIKDKFSCTGRATGLGWNCGWIEKQPQQIPIKGCLLGLLFIPSWGTFFQNSHLHVCHKSLKVFSND